MNKSPWFRPYREYPIKARDLRRIKRYTMKPFTRATLWPVETVAEERHQRRVIALLDILVYIVLAIIAVCFVLVIVRGVW